LFFPGYSNAGITDNKRNGIWIFEMISKKYLSGIRKCNGIAQQIVKHLRQPVFIGVNPEGFR